MISAFANAFRIPELKKRIFFTLGVVFISRLGAAIPVPGVDAGALHRWFGQLESSQGGSMMAMLNIFSGGSLEHLAIFSLTVMPYISASIIFQLLTAVVPQLTKIAREEGGRQKITQLTRYATVVIALFQSYMFARTFENAKDNPMFRGLTEPLVLNPGLGFELTTIITLTAGTIFLMWMGEQITERGIGNGVSMLIATNILAKFPAAVVLAVQIFTPHPGKVALTPIHAGMFVVMFFGVIAAVIVVTQAQRKIAVQYAQRMVGRRIMGGGQTYMPLRVNYSGVMPIIFASSFLLFPRMMLGFIDEKHVQWLLAHLDERSFFYSVSYAVLIFSFSYFWVFMVFNPIQIADDLKKNGGYVLGYRPGKHTAEFLDYTMTRITFAGAIFLVMIAIIPIWLYNAWNVQYLTANFFGGTSLLIVVGVLLDTLRQIETHLITRDYEGFLKKGRMRGRI